MQNPVIAPDGYTYEQHAITAWLLEHGTSPQTRETMSICDLIPNRAISHLLEQKTEIPSRTSSVLTDTPEKDNTTKVDVRSLLSQLLYVETTSQ